MIPMFFHTIGEKSLLLFRTSPKMHNNNPSFRKRLPTPTLPNPDVHANSDPGPIGVGDPIGYAAPTVGTGLPGTSDPVVANVPNIKPAIDPTIYTFPDVKPEFPGGEKEMYKYLSRIKYPAYARDNGISGRVSVRFVVNENGKVSHVEILKGIGAGCDEEAQRVISSMPAWKPGKKNGRAVKAYYTMPVFFKLE